MKKINAAYKFLGDTIIQLIIAVGLFGVPIICFIFRINYPNVSLGWVLFVFMSLLVVERVWETFYSTRESKRYKLHGDWTLPLVSIVYVFMLIGVILEYFLIRKEVNRVVTLFAFLVFIASFLLRIWGMRTLKEQWAVHAIGAQKVRDVFLVQTGPYKYIRHPIYLGVILEVVSIPLIWNAYFALVFVVLVNIPLQLIRAHFEEKTSIRKLGQDYVLYKSKVPALFPFNFLKISAK